MRAFFDGGGDFLGFSLGFEPGGCLMSLFGLAIWIGLVGIFIGVAIERPKPQDPYSLNNYESYVPIPVGEGNMLPKPLYASADYEQAKNSGKTYIASVSRGECDWFNSQREADEFAEFTGASDPIPGLGPNDYKKSAYSVNVKSIVEVLRYTDFSVTDPGLKKMFRYDIRPNYHNDANGHLVAGYALYDNSGHKVGKGRIYALFAEKEEGSKMPYSLEGVLFSLPEY